MNQENSQQSKRMIEESTRPILIIYSTNTNIGENFYYLIVRNYGKSIAKVNKVISSFNFIQENAFHQNFSGIDLLKDLENSYIAPGQSKQILLDYQLTQGIEIEIIIEYSSFANTYSEIVKGDLTNGLHAPSIIPSTQNKELNQIVEILQNDFINRL